MTGAALSFDAGAAAYDRFMGRWSRLFVPAVLAAARVGPGHRALDVAAGTGEAAVGARAAVGPTGWVIATDISLPMLRQASARAGRALGLAAMDGRALALRGGVFDAVVCQLGLMFFADPLPPLRECRRVLRRGGWVACCVWSAAERVPLVGVLAGVLSRHLPAQTATFHVAFSLADPARLAALLTSAGFGDVTVVPERRRIALPSFDDYWEAVELGAGRLGQAYCGLPAASRAAVRDDVRRGLARFETDGRLEMEIEALIACGQARE
jgi:ubiquinone/menaquinone biosynthesis C-methylase UbiE